MDSLLIRYGESIWPGTSPRQTELNTWIGNLEPDFLAGEGGWVAANRPSCRTKWSEWDDACQCFLLYILICISLINPQGLRQSLDPIDLSPTSCNLVQSKERKRKTLWLNMYVIASAKEIDALNITLFSCINSTNVHLCNYCTKIFVIVVNTCVCRRSVDNKAVILSYPYTT